MRFPDRASLRKPNVYGTLRFCAVSRSELKIVVSSVRFRVSPLDVIGTTPCRGLRQ